MPGNPSVPSLAPQEQDVHALLRCFLRKIDSGSPLSYATFREAWHDLHFSLIYEGCLEHSTLPAFMQSLFAVACDHLQAPLPPANAPASDPVYSAIDPAGGSESPPDQAQEPAAAGDMPAAASPAHAQAGSAEESRPCSSQAATSSQRRQRAKRPASGRDLLAAAVARSAGVASKATGAASQEEHSTQRRQQPAAMPRIDSAALRTMLLEEGDAEQSGLRHIDASQNGGIAEGVGGSPDHEHIQRLVSTLGDLDVPDVEPEHADETLGTHQMEEPGQISAVQQAVETTTDYSAPSLALQVGALYTIYTIHETQPCAQKVRPYVPLSSLRIMLETVRATWRRGVPDVAAVVKRLVESNAIVFGAVLRPPACMPAPPVQQPKMAQVDMRARNEVLPLTLKHLQATHADLRELKHLQLLCDSYRSAQARVFAAADPDDLPPSIADLDMGQRLSSMLNDVALTVQDILETGMATRKRGGKRSRKRGCSTGQDGTSEVRQEESAALPDEEDTLEAAAAGIRLTNLEGPGGEDLDLSGLPAAARRVEIKKARERVAMRQKQALWAARGAAALAAASDMPGEAPAADSPPQRERPRTHDASGGPRLTEGAANSPPQQKRPRRTCDTWGDQAAATPRDLRLADGVPETTPDEASGAGVQLEDLSQPAERGLRVAEQHTEADGGLQAIGAAPKGLADRSGDGREAGRHLQAKPRRHVEKCVAEESANGLESAVEATEKQRIPMERSTAAGLRTGPRELTGGEPSEQQMERAAAADTQAGIGGSGDAAAESQLGDGGSANAQDELEGLELNIYGLPVIPDLRNGHSMPASPFDGDINHMDDADTNGFESDVSDEGDKVATASTVAPREHEQRSEVAQPTQKGQALPDSVETRISVGSADRSGRVTAKEPTAAGGTDRWEQMNGCRPVPEQRQTKGRRETAEARGKEGPSKAAAAKAPRKRERRRLDSSKPSAAQCSQASVEAQPRKLVALLETEPPAPSNVRPRKRAALAVEQREPGSSMAQFETEPPSVVHPGRKAASAVEQREADSSAAPAPPETVLPPRKRAKAGMLRGGPDLSGVRDAPIHNSQHAAADSAAGKSSAERQEHKAAERPAVGSKQPNGSARAARADQGKGQKGAAVDWAAYATDMARLAAEAEALLAEEEDDL